MEQVFKARRELLALGMKLMMLGKKKRDNRELLIGGIVVQCSKYVPVPSLLKEQLCTEVALLEPSEKMLLGICEARYGEIDWKSIWQKQKLKIYSLIMSHLG